MSNLVTEKLGRTVGAEVTGVDRERLRDDPDLPGAVLDGLEQAGVLVFRDLHLDPETQVEFCKKIGPIETQFTKAHPVEGVMRVNLDPSKTGAADYLRGNFGWHIDGCTPQGDEYPPMVTMLTAQVVAEGGDTEFASTYAAYDDLSEEEKDEFATLRVLHKFESAVLPFLDNPTPEHLARLRSQPTKVHPLVGLISPAGAHLSSGPTPTTSWTFPARRVVRCLPTCSSGPPTGRECTVTVGPPATPSCGTTADCCTTSPPTTSTSPETCSAQPFWVRSRFSSGSHPADGRWSFR